ncbi:hypothetical protein Ssi03_51100 [Sphaerisporangium siamense]|uniref:Uncharacterized protein n=1 Tax=Sphaerisporangium siamense TaxID=795645 RepID=A0A7W7DAT5_9ACTN|nr:hypothetical protein [Sphaerisporangium siamense]MBB4702186.1 hypothetical protein [Sphaerisporangium siamense]GII87120.1 hypothetical protein Ssi03_51100 [Sphaerisporangium siamense]
MSMSPTSLQFHLAHVDPDGALTEAERIQAAEARHRVFVSNGRLGGLTSWGNTQDRKARTKPGHSRSPASLDHWIAKVRQEQEQKPAGQRMSSDDQLKAATARHKAHMLRLAQASAQARRIRAAMRNHSTA